MLFCDLETERLRLKCVSHEDDEFMYKQFSNEAVCRYLFDEEPYTDIGQARELIDYFTLPEPRTQHRWIVMRKDDGVKMGTCGFHKWNFADGTAETGYDLDEQYWGCGYMREAMKRILAFAAESMKARAVNAVIYPGNERSAALAKKLGFRLSGSSFEVFRNEKIAHDVYTLNLTNACQEGL